MEQMEHKVDENNLLQIYFDEWKFRQESLWKRMIQFLVINFFITTMPITVTAFSGVKLPSSVGFYVYPICGIAISVIFFVFCLSESYRINSIDRLCKKIISDTLPKYEKRGLVSFDNAKADRGVMAPKLFQKPMAVWVPTLFAVLQIVLAISMIFIIKGGL